MCSDIGMTRALAFSSALATVLLFASCQQTRRASNNNSAVGSADRATPISFSTDGGNRILDCQFRAITDPGSLDGLIGQTIGVVETGLFIGMAEVALIADAAGVRAIRRGK